MIKSVEDVSTWLTSNSCLELTRFIHRIAISVKQKTCKLVDETQASSSVCSLLEILQYGIECIDQFPPEPMNLQRFGNKAFRSWHQFYTAKLSGLLLSLSAEVSDDTTSAYLVDSFGNPQRLDYGTGHELNFMVFLLILHKLNISSQQDFDAVALLLIPKYLELVRTLQTVYSLEPAGSHGLWGLDDYQFIPFIIGSAQLCDCDSVPQEALDLSYVRMSANENLFFDSVLYITQGASIHEHSPMLCEICSLPSWERVYQTLTKMYQREVLGKFPVVQHLCFSSNFPFN